LGGKDGGLKDVEKEKGRRHVRSNKRGGPLNSSEGRERLQQANAEANSLT